MYRKIQVSTLSRQSDLRHLMYQWHNKTRCIRLIFSDVVNYPHFSLHTTSHEVGIRHRSNALRALIVTAQVTIKQMRIILLNADES